MNFNQKRRQNKLYQMGLILMLTACGTEPPEAHRCSSKFYPYQFKTDRSAEVFLRSSIPVGSTYDCISNVMNTKHMYIAYADINGLIAYRQANTLRNRISGIGLNTKIVAIHMKKGRMVHLEVR